MKLAIKLRTRLFLSISALITVALMGLVLGVFGVMQMAKTQEALIRNNFITLDLGLKLRQTLGDQLILMLHNEPDTAELKATSEQYLKLLDEGIEHERKHNLTSGFAKARVDYVSFLEAFNQTHRQGLNLSNNNDLTNRFNALRNGLIDEHRKALETINTAQAQARERAMVIATVLGLVGVAVLIIGFITAHGGLGQSGRQHRQRQFRSGFAAVFRHRNEPADAAFRHHGRSLAPASGNQRR